MNEDNSEKIEQFAVINAGNTCYIDSLLMGMFFFQTSNDYLLRNDIKDGMSILLQESIKNNFVECVRKYKTVTGDTVSAIRYFCHNLGWKKENPEELLEQQDVMEFYEFLMRKFEGTFIKIQRETITEALRDSDDIGKERTIPYITLALPDDNIHKSVTIKKMLNDWMHHNIKDVERVVITENGTEKKNVKGLDIIHITNNPPIIGLGIHRFYNMKDSKGDTIIKRNNIDVIIQKKISPFYNKFGLNRSEWIFHSAICHPKLYR